ncbi:DUF4230 domain-containing protein [Brevibacillus dissolubilis]|uniref:DUF4230 domain-containing protein n=1 Tax=Brevibacillus dissolubilis TaxID=1844116 RepID=UPI00159B9480|nr:DUF4230 domain-containing protein [Brevibacillus dissolubilis]
MKPDTGKLLGQLEGVLEQLKEAEQQTSATMASDSHSHLLPPKDDPHPTDPSHPTPSAPFLTKRRLAYMLGTLLLLLLAAFLFTALLPKPIHDTEVFVTELKELNHLSTAEAIVMTTVEGEDHKLFGRDLPFHLPGTQRFYFLVVPAKVTAGIDLSNISQDDISIDHINKTIQLQLPKATIQNQLIQLDKVKIFTDEGLFRSTTTVKEGLSFISNEEMTRKINREATDAGLLQSAEKHTEELLQRFAKQIGYEIQVEFK